jgi:hypothetical protein
MYVDRKIKKGGNQSTEINHKFTQARKGINKCLQFGMVAKTNWKINTESNREYYFHL